MPLHSPLPEQDKPVAGDTAGPDGDVVSCVLREHGPKLHSYVRRHVGHREDAADIVQEASLRLLRYAHLDASALRALLYRIASNLIALRARERGRRIRLGVEPEPLLDQPVPADLPLEVDRLIAEQRLERLSAAIETLPPKCRQVFVLSRFHGMTYPQIAAHCGISVKMVEKHIGRALSVCRSGVGEA